MASPKTSKKKKPYGPYKGYYPQKYLYQYLKIKLDPYDMPHRFLEQWGEEAGVEIGDDDFADSLKSDQLKAYEAWLIENDKGAELVGQDPAGAPAYLTIQEPKLVPKGSWAIHFTNREPFEAFEQGATIPRLALSTWWKEKEKASCPENLTEELGDYEYVYIFAFDALKTPIRYGMKYGKNAVLFQTDAAIEAWHLGDDETQWIIPACSERNVIPLRGVGDGISCSFDDSEEEGLTFDSVKDLIAYVEQGEARGERPLARLRC